MNAGGGKWEHNPQHRGGTPYSDRATANKYGGTARGDSLNSRQASARQQGARPSTGTANRAGGAGAGNRAAGGAGGRADASGLAAHQYGGSASRAPPRARRRGSGGGDRVGNRSVPKSSGSTVQHSAAAPAATAAQRPGQQLARRLQHGVHGGGMRGGGGRGGGGRR